MHLGSMENTFHDCPIRKQLESILVVVRGAGEMATGVAYRLAKSGFRVVLTDIAQPLAVRRAVSFSEAVWDGRKTVEGLTARLIENVAQAWETWAAGELPLLVDPKTKCVDELKPQVVVDALLAKCNTGLSRDMAPFTRGLGPGFLAPQQVHLAIETMRGHDLGRLIYRGTPLANTSNPGAMAGFTHQRVLRAPADGEFTTDYELGDRVEKGECVAKVGGRAVVAQVSGILRGLIRPGIRAGQGLKVGDIDPRGRIEYLHTISDKARALGGSVLEGIMYAASTFYLPMKPN
jgi:xanthine dehydrogenase accessory factor